MQFTWQRHHAVGDTRLFHTHRGKVGIPAEHDTTPVVGKALRGIVAGTEITPITVLYLQTWTFGGVLEITNIPTHLLETTLLVTVVHQRADGDCLAVELEQVRTFVGTR